MVGMSPNSTTPAAGGIWLLAVHPALTDDLTASLLVGALGARLAKRGMAGSIVAVHACTEEVFEREALTPTVSRG